MKQVYFNEEKLPFLKRRTINLVTKVGHSVAPDYMLKLSYKYLINPFSRRSVHFDNIQPTEILNVDCKLGKISLYKFEGGEKNILLTHGWADTSQSFRFLIKDLLKRGYTVWSFDQIGHGKSEGNISHLPGFIDGLKNVLNFFEVRNLSINTIISHSMGGAPILNIENTILKDTKIIFISLPVNMFQTMFEKMESMGIAKRVLISLLNDVSDDFNVTWSKLAPHNHKQKLNENYLFIHDLNDKVSPYLDLVGFTLNSKSELFTTQELGHRKVLSSKVVMNKIGEFINAS